MTPGQRRKQEWLRGLAELEPDLVVNTGDNLSHRDAVPVVTEALGALLDRPGVFVFGSNDYYSPTVRNPLRYLLPDDGSRNIQVPQLPWTDLMRAYVDAGWLDLTNGTDRLTVGGTTFAFAGVDDPHLRLRPARHGARAGRRGRRRTPRGHPRAVPAGARPVRRRRLRRRPRRDTPTAARSVCPSWVR